MPVFKGIALGSVFSFAGTIGYLLLGLVIDYFGFVPPQAQFFSAFYSSSMVFIPLITTATLLTLCAANL